MCGLGWPHGNQNVENNNKEREECLYTDYKAAYWSRCDKFNSYLKAVNYKILLKLTIIISLVG